MQSAVGSQNLRVQVVVAYVSVNHYTLTPQLSPLLLLSGPCFSTVGCWAHASSSTARVAPEFGLRQHPQLLSDPHSDNLALTSLTRQLVLASISPRLSLINSYHHSLNQGDITCEGPMRRLTNFRFLNPAPFL